MSTFNAFILILIFSIITKVVHGEQSQVINSCGLTDDEMVQLWNDHQKYEFSPPDKNVDATMETMTNNPFVNHVPTMAGGDTYTKVKSFYTEHFIFANPPDTNAALVSRTIGDTQIVDELIFSFTHTTMMPWILPNVEPTNKFISIPLVAVVGFENKKITKEHIYWDQASVLLQAGLIDNTDNKLPVFGSETTDVILKVKSPSGPTN